MSKSEFIVVEYNADGQFVAVISGMGHNRGTLDTTHTRSNAKAHAERLKQRNPDYVYRVQHQFTNVAARIRMKK